MPEQGSRLGRQARSIPVRGLYIGRRNKGCQVSEDHPAVELEPRNVTTARNSELFTLCRELYISANIVHRRFV